MTSSWALELRARVPDLRVGMFQPLAMREVPVPGLLPGPGVARRGIACPAGEAVVRTGRRKPDFDSFKDVRHPQALTPWAPGEAPLDGRLRG